MVLAPNGSRLRSAARLLNVVSLLLRLMNGKQMLKDGHDYNMNVLKYFGLVRRGGAPCASRCLRTPRSRLPVIH